jgi:hypothetical protein
MQQAAQSTQWAARRRKIEAVRRMILEEGLPPAFELRIEACVFREALIEISWPLDWARKRKAMRSHLPANECADCMLT